MLTCDQTTILRVIAEAPRQAHVAYPYALLLYQWSAVDWRAINDAIIRRWSPAGLTTIKTLAWSIGEAMNAMETRHDHASP